MNGEREQKLFAFLSRWFCVAAAFALVASALLVIGQQLLSQRVVKLAAADLKSPEPGQFTWEITDSTQSGAENTTVSGWCVEPGKLYEYFNYGRDTKESGVYNRYYLAYTDGTTVYRLPTKLHAESVVSEKMDDGINYEYSCFISQVKHMSRYAGMRQCFVYYRPDGTGYLIEVA